MAINKLWIIIIAAVVILLLVALLAFPRTPTPDTARADAEHNAFMVDGAANDHETGVASPLGSGKPRPRPTSNDHETGAASSFGSGQPKH